MKKDKEELAKDRAKIDQKKDRILEAYTEKIIDKSEFSEKIENYREQERELTRRMEEIEQRLKDTETKFEDMIAEVVFWKKMAQEKLKKQMREIDDVRN